MEVSLIPNKSSIRGTRFLDDEYPSLGCNSLPDRKKESNHRHKNEDASGVGNKIKNINSSNLSKEAKIPNTKDNDSASEWETENEDVNSRSTLKEEKQIVNFNAQKKDKNHIEEASQLKFTCENCPQPRSILRRISNEAKCDKEQTGKFKQRENSYYGKNGIYPKSLKQTTILF